MITRTNPALWVWSCRPPSLVEEVDRLHRRRWWSYALAEFLPKDPPSPSDPDAYECRFEWWKRVPVDRLPDRPPTESEEERYMFREKWWRRIPVDKLPEFPPTVQDEPSWFCRELWWLRKFPDLLAQSGGIEEEMIELWKLRMEP